MAYRIGIAGATGYVGIELVRILSNHPKVELTYISSQSYVGDMLTHVYPHLAKLIQLECDVLDPLEMSKTCDIIFTALPHGHAVIFAQTLLSEGKKLIDLGADFRLRNGKTYEEFYNKSPAPDTLLGQAIYGLPEINREKIKKSHLIANPGCYPTCAALGVIPALHAEIVDTEAMIFDAKSGVSGAGRELSLTSHFCEVAENFKAYNIAGKHRHAPEIEQILSEIVMKPTSVLFTPHLLPMIRGLLVTSYLKLNIDIPAEEVMKIYENFYRDESFIRISPKNELPQTANVRGSNFCDIGFMIDAKRNYLIVISVIDNLIKGAAGQAVQNMNLMLGLPESEGLSHLYPTYP